jgi:hypothetical protein
MAFCTLLPSDQRKSCLGEIRPASIASSQGQAALKIYNFLFSPVGTYQIFTIFNAIRQFPTDGLHFVELLEHRQHHPQRFAMIFSGLYTNLTQKK